MQSLKTDTAAASLDDLSPGCVVTSPKADEKRYLRILHCDPEVLLPTELWFGDGPHVVLIDILNASAWPILMPLNEVARYLVHRTWVRHTGLDPFAFAFRHTDEIDESLRDGYVLHQQRTSWFVHVVTDSRPSCYLHRPRARLMAGAATAHNVSPSAVRKWIRFFWQSGEDENSLWPRHRFAGTTTISEVLAEQNMLPKRRGRRRVCSPDIPPPDVKQGEEDLALPSRGQDELFLKGWDEYVKENRDKRLISSGNGIPFTDAFRYTLTTYFETRTKIVPDRRGKPVPTPVDTREDLLPTLKQFKRVVLKNREASKVVKELEGTRIFNLNFRLKYRDTRPMALGSGTCFQIDWMLADIYLVNRISGMPCGRPYVFFVLDTFSRMIVGLHVTFDPPNYRAAAQALINTFTNKGPYLLRHDVPLDPSKWACHHLCWRLLADNGELAQNASDTIVQMSVSDIANTPPFRGDLKVLVENSFRCGNMGTVRFLPGMTRGPRERCAPDPKLQSQLNVIQFTGLLIHWLVTVFNTRILAKYARTELMGKFPVALVPNELWQWGFQHMGRARQMPESEVRRRLMPTADATVREDGIWLNNVCFVSADPTIEKHLFRAQHHGNFDLRCSYDPAIADSIALLSGPDGTPLTVPISDKSADLFRGKSFQEVAMFLEDDNAMVRLKRQTNERARRADRARARKIIDEAGSIQAAQHGGLDERNKLVSLSDPKVERENEARMMRRADLGDTDDHAPKSPRHSRTPKPRPVDIRTRFLQETSKGKNS